MPNYSAVGQDTNTASTTIMYVVNSSTSARRIKLFDLIIGSDATPGDQAAEYNIRHVTTENGTPGGTAITPRIIDMADPASLVAGVEAPSGEPTYSTGIHLMIALNQRPTFRWVAAPGSELVSLTTDDDGWGLFVAGVTTAYNANSTFIFSE